MMTFIILVTDAIKWWEQIKAGQGQTIFFKVSSGSSYRPQSSYSRLHNSKQDHTTGPSHTTYAQAVAIKMNIYWKINCQIIEPRLHNVLGRVVFLENLLSRGQSVPRQYYEALQYLLVTRQLW